MKVSQGIPLLAGVSQASLKKNSQDLPVDSVVYKVLGFIAVEKPSRTDDHFPLSIRPS